MRGDSSASHFRNNPSDAIAYGTLAASSVITCSALKIDTTSAADTIFTAEGPRNVAATSVATADEIGRLAIASGGSTNAYARFTKQ